MQVDERFRIDKDPHIVELEDAIPLAGLRVEANVVAQARTPASLYAEAQAALLGRDAFLGHCAPDFGDGFVGHLNALGWSLGRGLFRCSRHSVSTHGRSG